MLQSLYSKLAAVLTVLFCLVGVSFVAVTVFSTRMYQQEVHQKLNAGLADQIVASRPLWEEGGVNRQALDEIFHMLMVINPAIEIYLLDLDGTILAFSAPAGKIKRKRVDLVPVRQWLEGSTPLPLLGEDPRDPNGRKVFSAAPVTVDGERKGYLYVILGGQIYDSIVDKIKGSYILQLSAWMILASLLFALVAGLLLFALLTARLRRLTGAVEAFGRGSAEAIDSAGVEIPAGRVDELDRLQRTFTRMARQIREQMQRLETADQTRRELVANVSHDLRTPLATLQGYIETLLLKNDSLDPDRRREYLQIAIEHCHRLSRLVDDLLELAKLESLESPLRLESFPLGELVQDVVQKFRLPAENKQIAITTNVGREIPFVTADIALIERVLENLVENAIHYTSTGGSVSVLLEPMSGEVAVQVSDTGKGMSAEDLDRIFHRFARLEQKMEDEAGHLHTGLGLAIARRILQLHGGTIEVSSTPNRGSTFSFSLPASRSVS
ncbi:MAG: HAMP domain-containing histidine kinase [Desulfobacteraceae bacterium]|nr:HAMP domain-containing histidine kinase [Desulfobacteraceae bacterium]